MVRIALLPVALISLSLGGVNPRGRAPEPTLSQTDSARVAALVANDFATLDKLLGEDLTFGHTNSKIDTKKSYLDDLRAGTHRYKSLSTAGVTARDYGCAGVVTGTAMVDNIDRNGEQSFSMHYTATYARRADRWVLVAYQSVRIP